jgi:glutathione S-transferase
MHLYFAPLACSLATRIAFYEAGVEARYTQVDTRVHRLVADGSDYFAINPLGQVPMLETEDGELLTENTAVLQYVADHLPQARLAPTDGFQHARMQQWLGFVGTELHKGIFIPLLDSKAPADAKRYARDKVSLRFSHLNNYLASREHLLDAFSIADAYLVTILNWTRATDIDLKQWPAVNSYFQKQLTRPSVAKAFAEEFALYKEEQARKAS